MSIHSFFEKFFENVFTNWQVKILSFGIAVLLYATFQIISLDTKSFSIPLQVREGGNFTAIESAPNAVRITVKGKTEEIIAIQKSDIRAYIDTSVVVKSGTSRLPIKLDLINELTLIDPFDVEVNPHTIELGFEENSFAWIPVEPIFKGLVPDGYEVLSWECVPSDIKITGIKSIVDSIPVIYADGVDLNEQTNSFTFVAKLQSVNNNIKLLAENTVSVYVEIVPQIINRTYTDVISRTDSLSPEFVLAEPLPFISFELSGEKNLLTDYDLKDNAIELDFAGITEIGEYTIPLRLNIPDNFDQVSITHETVVVKIVLAPVDILDTENQAETMETIPTTNLDNAILLGEGE